MYTAGVGRRYTLHPFLPSGHLWATSHHTSAWGTLWGVVPPARDPGLPDSQSLASPCGSFSPGFTSRCPALAQRSSAHTAHCTATGSEFANILVLRPTPGQVLWYLWGWGPGISIFKAPPRKVWRAARTDSQLLVRTFRALGQRQTFHPRGAE